jgi:hypothetical protein
VKLQRRIIDWAEDMIRHRTWAESRRFELKKTVSDA